MSIIMPNTYTPVDGFDSCINITSREFQCTLKKWQASWIWTLGMQHHHNAMDLQLVTIERDNAKLIDTIALARTFEFISQGQIEQARRFSRIAQEEQDRAQEAVFEPTKWAKKPFNTHGYKEIEMAVFEYIKLDHDRSCPWVQIAQVTKAPTISWCRRIAKPARTVTLSRRPNNSHGYALLRDQLVSVANCVTSCSPE